MQAGSEPGNAFRVAKEEQEVMDTRKELKNGEYNRFSARENHTGRNFGAAASV